MRLPEYIEDELHDALYYQQLSQLAPTDFARRLLLEFSNDELHNAHRFQEVYCMLTGQYYAPGATRPIELFNYEQGLKNRLMEETRAYKVYGEEYLLAPIKTLEDMFFSIRTIEAQHAMRIPIL